MKLRVPGLITISLCSMIFLSLATPLVGVAQTGTITGRAPAVQGFKAGAVRAYSFDGTGEIISRPIRRNGTFSIPAPEGRYVVLTSMFGRRGATQRFAFADVKSNRRSNISRLTANAPTNGLRISVGNVVARGPRGQTFKNTSGRPTTLDDFLIVDLLNGTKPCSFGIYEDRRFGRFQDVVKELRRQSTRYFKNPINLPNALAVLNANAPQYRVTGSVGVSGPDNSLTGSASIQFVDLANGQVRFSKTFSGLPRDLGAFSAALASKVAAEICVPRRIVGTFSGIQRIQTSSSNETYEWQGTAALALQTALPSDPSRPENLDVNFYSLESGQIDSFRRSGSLGNCSVLGESGPVAPVPPTVGAMLVNLTPTPQLGYKYDLSVQFINPGATTRTITCPGNVDTESQDVSADLVVSADASQLPFSPSLGRFTGSTTIDSTTYTWDFYAAP